MNKRILSVILALSMALSVGVYAEPEEEAEEVLTFVFESEEDGEQEDALLSETEEEEEKLKETTEMLIELTIGEPRITVNGDIVTELDVAPVIMNDRTMVPLRAIFEALGASISWDDETKTVFAVKDYTIILMQIGQDTMFVNSERIELDAPSVIVDDRTLVPLRAIAEAFGNEVGYDDETKTVTVKC